MGGPPATAPVVPVQIEKLRIFRTAFWVSLRENYEITGSTVQRYHCLEMRCDTHRCEASQSSWVGVRGGPNAMQRPPPTKPKRAIAPQCIEQLRIVLSIFRVSAPIIQRDCPSTNQTPPTATTSSPVVATQYEQGHKQLPRQCFLYGTNPPGATNFLNSVGYPPGKLPKRGGFASFDTLQSPAHM